MIRHAGTDQATVRVKHEPRAVTLEIVGDGNGANGHKSPVSGGHGLPGMERAALYGGELQAGPRNGGGYAVWARLSVGGAA